MEIPSLHLSIACLPPPSWAMVRNERENFLQKFHMQKSPILCVDPGDPVVSSPAYFSHSSPAYFSPPRAKNRLGTRLGILGDVRWNIAPSLIPWSAPPLPRKRGVGHTVDRSIKPQQRAPVFQHYYHYNISP